MPVEDPMSGLVCGPPAESQVEQRVKWIEKGLVFVCAQWVYLVNLTPVILARYVR
jgi:hypothetical protein